MRLLPRRLEPGEEATLVEHLGELRARLVVSLVAIAAGFGVAFAFHHEIIEWLNRPLPPERGKPVTFGVAEPFMTSFFVSLYAGFVLAMPIVIRQIWLFFAPAFGKQTQRVITGMTVFATVLGAAGLAFAYWVVLPAAIHFLTNFDSAIYDIQIRARDYYSFTTMVLMAVAVVFEVPLVILGLVRIGVFTPRKLRSNRRIGYVVMAVIAVALPGVDPITTMLEMLPLFILFEGSIWLAIFFDKRWKTEAAQREAEWEREWEEWEESQREREAVSSTTDE